MRTYGRRVSLLYFMWILRTYRRFATSSGKSVRLLDESSSSVVYGACLAMLVMSSGSSVASPMYLRAVSRRACQIEGYGFAARGHLHSKSVVWFRWRRLDPMQVQRQLDRSGCRLGVAARSATHPMLSLPVLTASATRSLRTSGVRLLRGPMVDERTPVSLHASREGCRRDAISESHEVTSAQIASLDRTQRNAG